MDAQFPGRLVNGGVTLSVRLQPKASRDGIDGLTMLSDGTTSLKVRVRALPEKGAANKALIRLLAKSFGCARSDMEVVAGAKDRNKTVRISGDPDAIARQLTEWLREFETRGGND